MQTQTSTATSSEAQRRTALRAISEQSALPLDQLARFLSSDIFEAEQLVEQLKEDRLAKARAFYVNDSPWVWLTREGASLSGTGLSHQPRGPYHVTLKHRRAVNQVRLHLEQREPQGRWVSETQLQGRKPLGAQIPDGLFEVNGERHAIEVELSAKSKRHYRQLLTDNCARYDAVVYFCAAVTGRLLRRLKAEGTWPNLIVRDLPPGSFSEPKRRPRLEAKRQPTAEELPILRLISEQGAIRIDQLGRFLGASPQQVERIAAELVDANYVSRQLCLVGEPDWIILTWVGNRLAGTSLSLFRAPGGAIKRWHALNELRLYVAARTPQAQWISRRRLARQYGRTAKLPGAEVRFDGRRYALNVRLAGTNPRTLAPRIDLQNDAYDAVVIFCATLPTRVSMERLQEQQRWSKVVIRDMPCAYATQPRPVEQLVDSLLGA